MEHQRQLAPRNREVVDCNRLGLATVHDYYVPNHFQDYFQHLWWIHEKLKRQSQGFCDFVQKFKYAGAEGAVMSANIIYN